MDDARLTQILEDTINMFGTQFLEQISQPLTDLSNSLLQIPSVSPLLDHQRNNSTTDIITNTHTTNAHATDTHITDTHITDAHTADIITDTHTTDMRKYQLLDKITAGWFRNTRDYQDIAYQMNSISEQLIHNITNIIDTDNRNSNNRRQATMQQATMQSDMQNNPFLIELSGFSLPLRRTTSPEVIAAAYPNIQQVMAATEIFLCNTATAELSCPITLEEFVIGEELCRMRHCSHVFTWRYLQEWFCTNSHCPVCRYDIREFVPPH